MGLIRYTYRINTQPVSTGERTRMRIPCEFAFFLNLYRHYVRSILYYGISVPYFSGIISVFRDSAIQHVPYTIGFYYGSRCLDYGCPAMATGAGNMAFGAMQRLLLWLPQLCGGFYYGCV